MKRKSLYTAIGRFECRTNRHGQTHPVILLSGNEYMADLQEMIIWSILNWRIVRMEEIGILYEEAALKSGFSTERTWEDCVKRLLMRGLLICGKGETEYDALYDLLAAFYIVPTESSPFRRAASFLKLSLFSHVPFSSAKRLFHRDRRTEDETKVMVLAGQALLSTAEIIKCVEKDISRLPCEESILDALYDDQYTTSDNLPFLARSSPSSRPVILAVSNLYLRQQIIFERI